MITTLLLVLSVLQDPSASVEGFSFATGRLSVGRVYHYQKSNIDGSNPSHVDLYVASETRLESFKYHDGVPEASLVVADMDWETFSVRRFLAEKRRPGGVREPIAELEAKGRALHGKFRGQTFEVPVEYFPWHSYDFDLASLNVAMRYLEDPEGIVALGVIDVVDGKLGFKGVVELAYDGDEPREGVPCRRYTIDGPGLEDRGGSLWVRLGEDPVIVDYEIDLPDEPGMESGRLRLVGTAELTSTQWADWMESKLEPGPAPGR